MAFTEFYCDAATGANINAGDNATTVTTTTNGNYLRAGGAGGTDLFTATGGTPFSTAAVGDFVSVYADGATVTTFTGRITAINAGGLSIDISLTAISGTRPATGATGNSATIGGKWKGPNGTVNFPFNHIANTLTNAALDVPRVNFKSGTNYAVTAAITHSLAGPIRFQGYTTTVNDGGRATIADITTTASYSLFTISSANSDYWDLIFDGSVFTTGASSGVVVNAAETNLMRCVAHDFRGAGFETSANPVVFAECEAYLCNKSSSATTGAFKIASAGCALFRCISHDNLAGDTDGHGFSASSAAYFINCIADSNGGNGFNISATTTGVFSGCDTYNNGAAGIDFSGSTATSVFIENCNFIKNATYGINSSGSLVLRNGLIINCGFGAGTQANGTANVIASLSGISTDGSVNYASNVTPWVDPANGDFRINLATAKGAGRGAFTETQASYTGTVGYPDIGAAQHIDSGGAGQTSSAFVA